jgi:hypothetical protein
MNMRAVVGISLLALGLLLPSPGSSEDEEPGEEVPTKSPDGKFLLRAPNDAEREKLKEDEAPKLGLYEMPSGKRITCPPLDNLEGFLDSLRVIWSKDSTHMAFNFRAGGRYYTTALCEVKTGKTVDLPSPEDLCLGFLRREKAAQVKELGLKPDVYQRRIHDAVSVRRWIDGSTIEVDAHSISTVSVKENEKDEDEEPEIVDIAAQVRFTLKLDAKKKAWKIVKTEKLKEV